MKRRKSVIDLYDQAERIQNNAARMLRDEGYDPDAPDGRYRQMERRFLAARDTRDRYVGNIDRRTKGHPNVTKPYSQRTYMGGRSTETTRTAARGGVKT